MVIASARRAGDPGSNPGPGEKFFSHKLLTDGNISVGIKIGVTFIFKLHRRPIQLLEFVFVGLSSFLRHPGQVI